MAEGTKVGTGYVDVVGDFGPLHRQLEQFRAVWARQTRGLGASLNRSMRPALDDTTKRVGVAERAVAALGSQFRTVDRSSKVAVGSVERLGRATDGLGRAFEKTRKNVHSTDLLLFATRTRVGELGATMDLLRRRLNAPNAFGAAGFRSLAREVGALRAVAARGRTETDYLKVSADRLGASLDVLRRRSAGLSRTLAAAGMGDAAREFDRAGGAAERAGERTRSGFRRSLGSLRDWSRQSARARGDALRLEQAQQRAATGSRSLSRAFSSLGGRTTVVNQRFQLLRNALSALRWPAIITGAGLAAQALSGLGAAAVAVTAALGPAVGVLGALPGALAAAAQGFSVFKLASLGVVDALREQLRNQFAVASGASQAADASRAVEGAERAQAQASRQLSDAKVQVTDAEQALTVARRDAARAIQDQRRQVVTATRDEERATLDLRDARAALQALQAGPDELDLADARDRTADATREIADAELDYAEALARSTAVLNDPTASPLQQARARSELADAESRIGDSRRALTRATRDLDQMERGPSRRDLAKARLDVHDAEGRLTDTIVARKRATVELQDLEARGVDRSEQVVQAERALAQAHQGVRDAELAVADAARGLSDAQQGVVGTSMRLNEEFDRLPRSAQQFVRTLLDLKPRFDELRAVAADGLFPGARAGLLSAMGAFGPVRAVVDATSRTLGGLAAQAGRLIGSRSFGRDLQLVGLRNTRVIRRVGEASLAAADGLRHVTVAAGPLLGWLSRVALGWARTFRESSKAGRESGRLAGFFDRTRAVLERLGSITGNVARAFWNIGRAAAPLGREILAALDRASGRFARWTSSFRGQNTLRRYFDDARPAIFEMGRLLRDVTTSFFRLGSQPGVARLLRQVRTELLPAIERMLGALQQSFGPALVSALTSVVGLFSQLAGAGGALSSTVRLFGGLAKATGWLIENVPGVRQLTFALIALGGAFTAFRILGTVTGVSKLAGGIARLALAYKGLRAGAAATEVIARSGVAATGAAQVAASGRLASLFSFGGMLRAAGGRGAVAASGSRLGRILGGSIGRSATQALGGAGGSLAGAIPAGGFAGRLAGRLAVGLRRALPGAIAAAGVGNIVMSAAEGDTKKAMWETGGAAAGGLVGGLVGGLPGAMIGSGLGSLAGTLLNNSFGGAADTAGRDMADRMVGSLSERLQARLNQAARPDFQKDILNVSGGEARERLAQAAGAARLNAVYEQMQRTRVRMSQTEVASLRAAAQSLNLTRSERGEVNRIIGLLERGSRLRIGVSLNMDQATRRMGNAFRVLRSGVLSNLTDILRVSRRNSRLIADTLGTRSNEGRRAMARNFRATADAVETAMKRAGVRTREGMELIRRLIRNAKLVDPTRKQAQAIGRAWADGMDQSREITRRGLAAMLSDARKMPGPMRKVALDTWLGQVEAARKNGRITKREFEDLRSSVATEFTGMRTASREAARRVPENVGNLTTASTEAFGVLTRNMNTALRAFGVRPLTFRFEKVREQRKQRGGAIVPGTGSGDTFHTAVPAGSFILNRNATAAFGFNRGGHVPVALEPRERVFFPDEVRRVGLGRLQAMNAAVPRFQTGGLAGASFNVDGAKPGFVPFMNYLHSMFGPLYVMSGLRPGAITTSGNVSNHAGGNAVDISTQQNGLNFAHDAASLNATGAAAARMDALYAFMAKWIPTARVSGDFLWRTFTGGNHFNHIHRGITNGLQHSAAAMAQFLSGLPKGAGFGGLERLVLAGADGPLKRIGQGAIDRVYKAANRYLTAKSSMPMFGTGKTELPDGAVGDGAELMKKISRERGWNFADWWEIDRRETSHGTDLVNPTSTARLRGQFLDMNWGKYGPGSDPRVNPSMAQQIEAMAAYIAARYGNPTAALAHHNAYNWYQRGGLVQALQQGGLVQAFQGGGIAENIGKLGRVLKKPLKRRAITGLIARTLRLIDGIGVSRSLQASLTELSNQSDVWAEWGSRAGQLSYEMLYGERTLATDANGRPVLDGSGRPTYHEVGDPMLDEERRPRTFFAQVNGQTEAGWTNDRLGALFSLRNKLVQAKDVVIGEQGRVAALIDQTRRRLAKIAEAVRRADAERRRLLARLRRAERQLADERDDLARWRREPRRNRTRIEHSEARIADLRARIGGIRERLGQIDTDQQNRARARANLNAVLGDASGGTRTGLLGRQATMGEYLPQLLENGGDGFKGLVTVQGLGGPLHLLPSLPPIGELGGEILDAQLTLRQLNTKPDPVPAPDPGDATAATDDSERTALLEQILRETQQRLAVSQAQYRVLGDLPPYGGSFATGGVVPGAVGEARTIIAHGGERVLSVADQRSSGGERPIVVQIVVERGAGVDESRIRAVVEGVTRQASLVGARGMPGMRSMR